MLTVVETQKFCDTNLWWYTKPQANQHKQQNPDCKRLENPATKGMKRIKDTNIIQKGEDQRDGNTVASGKMVIYD